MRLSATVREGEATMLHRGITGPVALAAAVFALGLAAPDDAMAQGSIQVSATSRAGTPVTGTATARGQGGTYSCTLRAGVCVMGSVVPGSYAVTLSVVGSPPLRRSVTVGRTRASVVFAVSTARSTTPHVTKSYERRPSGGAPPGATGYRPVHTKSVSARQLSTGSRLVVQGTATDRAGTPVAGSIEVRRGTTFIGTARVVTGRFTIFDLPPGTYTLTLREQSGGRATRTVTVGRSPLTVVLVAAR